MIKSMDAFPVPFIVGVPRSGTTLLRLMLDAHPDLAIPPETFFVPQAAAIEDRDEAARELFFRTVVGARVWRDFHLSETVFHQELQRLDPFNAGDGLRLFFSLYARRLGKKRWGDKTPGYNSMMNVIEAVLPEAHFIHLVRDGRDVALSHRQANFWWAAGGVTDHAEYWVASLMETHRQAAACRHFLEIRYEDLILNPLPVLTKICDYLQLPYDRSMEHFHLFSRERLDEFIDLQRKDGSIIRAKAERVELHRRTMTPPDHSRIGRWRREMSDEETALYQATARDMLLKFDYELVL